MSDKTELIRGWLRKAASNTAAMNASMHAGALDAACFHAQQAVEIYLKVFLIHAEVEFPYSHNLARLAELCARVDASFHALIPLVGPLTPYAVELRYDHEFWPDHPTAQTAGRVAETVRAFVHDRLPPGIVE
jgi:HEPN domain-containing protein